MFVQLKALHALLEVELVEVVEGHQVPVAAEDVHLGAEDADALPVPCAGLFADDEAVAVVVDDLLLELLVVGLLVADRLQRLHHRLGDRRQLPLLLRLAARRELPEQLPLALLELLLLVLVEDLLHGVVGALGLLGRDALGRDGLGALAFLRLLFEGGRAVVDGVGGRVDLVPLRLLVLVDADVVLLLRHVLDPSEEEEVFVEAHHRVPSPRLNSEFGTSGVSLLSTLDHFFSGRLKDHMSFMVFTPLVPPKMSKLWLYSTIEKLLLPCGSFSFLSPLWTVSQVHSSASKAKTSMRYSARSVTYPPQTYILLPTISAQWESTLGMFDWDCTACHFLVTKSQMQTVLLERLVDISPPKTMSFSLQTTPLWLLSLICRSPQLLPSFFQTYSSQSSEISISQKSSSTPRSTSYPPCTNSEFPNTAATWLDRLAIFLPSILTSLHRLSKAFSSWVLITRLEPFFSSSPDLLLQTSLDSFRFI